MRGGHYHDRKKFHLVLSGKILYEFVDPTTKKNEKITVEPLDLITIPRGVSYLLNAVEDSLFLESGESTKTVDYEPQRRLVRSCIETLRRS
jgi:quercetin dioxygenase-like cupin family protein